LAFPRKRVPTGAWYESGMTIDDVTAVDARASIEVADLDAALAFWTDIAGFAVEVTMGEPPMFAKIRNGAAHLALTRVDAPAPMAIAPVFVTLTGLDALLVRLAAAGIPLVSEPSTRPWGVRDITVRCPGGGPVIAFGEEVSR
jgi:catechol 2,3-dioxygenase-like lactoylglutathione lyase family enzyme